ncbi:MAG: hypothetical protein M1541_20210 [Acidobacteria bacterium]|nr:hypothetical protein [Acidobacteriota bacterium]
MNQDDRHLAVGSSPSQHLLEFDAPLLVVEGAHRFLKLVHDSDVAFVGIEVHLPKLLGYGQSALVLHVGGNSRPGQSLGWRRRGLFGVAVGVAARSVKQISQKSVHF